MDRLRSSGQLAHECVKESVWFILDRRVIPFAVALDGRELFAATDRTFTEAGRVGLWTKADSLTHFDALEIQMLRP